MTNKIVNIKNRPIDVSLLSIEEVLKKKREKREKKIKEVKNKVNEIRKKKP